MRFLLFLSFISLCHFGTAQDWQVRFESMMSYRDISTTIKELKGSSVSIEIIDTSTSEYASTCIGSGFIVLKDDITYAITNYHVASKSKNKVLVVGYNRNNQKEYIEVNMIKYDTINDIAVLEWKKNFRNKYGKIDSTLSSPIANGISVFETPDSIKEGMYTILIGYPLGIGSYYLGNKPISRIGIIAQEPDLIRHTFIIDGVVNHGNSGSPVYNIENNKLLGMVCSFPSDKINAYDELGKLIITLPYNSSLSKCVSADLIWKLIPTKYEKQLDDWNKVIASNSNDEAYYNRGTVYIYLKEYEKAIADFNKAIELNPKFMEAYHNRSEVFAILKQYEKALTDLTKAIDLKPEDYQHYMTRGYLYNIMKQYNKALTDLNKAIALNPQHAYAYNNRGYAYNNLKKYDKAIIDINKSISLDSTNAYAFYNRGLTYQATGNLEKAKADFDKATKLDPINKGHFE